MHVQNLPDEKIRIIILVSLWILASSLLFFGIIEVEPEGHIEIAVLLGAILIMFGYHLFTFLKSYTSNIYR